MKKILLSLLAIVAFCRCSGTFGMGNNTSYEDNIFSDEKSDSKLSASSKQSDVDEFSNLEKKKNIGAADLNCLSENNSEKIMHTTSSDEEETPDMMSEKEKKLETKQVQSDDYVSLMSAAMRWRKLSCSLERLKQREIRHALLKDDMYEKWLNAPAFRAVCNVLKEEATEMYNALKAAYSKMDAQTLLKKENADENKVSYFAWLEAVQDYLEKQGSFKMIVGDELYGVKEKRHALQKEFNDLNERLKNIKDKSNCLDFKQKLDFTLRSEIIQDDIETARKDIIDELSPYQGMKASRKMKYIKGIVCSIEKDLRKTKLNPLRQKKGNFTAELMLRMQAKNIYSMLNPYEEIDPEDTQLVRNEVKSIIEGEGGFLYKQKKMSEITNIYLSLLKSLERKKKEKEENRKWNFKEKELICSEKTTVNNINTDELEEDNKE